MSYVLNSDGSICWHCDSAFMADSLRRMDSAKWAPTQQAIDGFWNMTHSTIFSLIAIVVVGFLLLAWWQSKS